MQILILALRNGSRHQDSTCKESIILETTLHHHVIAVNRWGKMAEEGKRHQRSPTLQCFEKLSEKAVKCNICEVELGYSNGNTGAMLNYLKWTHFEVTRNLLTFLIVLTENQYKKN